MATIENFTSLHKGKIWSRFLIPEAKNKVCMESRGWLITVEGDESGEMNLLHPLSRVQIPLPNQSTCCPDEYRDWKPFPVYNFVTKAVLSACPSETDDYVVVVVHREGLGCWRPGEKSWSKITSLASDPKVNDGGTFGGFSDVNYYRGKFYAINTEGDFWCWEVSSPLDMAYQPLSLGFELVGGVGSYIVEVAGELLVVVRNEGFGVQDDDCNYETSGFRVVQLDLSKKEWREVKTLGGWSIFIGLSATFSVDASSSSFRDVIKPNCIYFTDDNYEAYQIQEPGGGRDMGIFNLEDGKVERGFGDIQSFSLIGPPLWISPSLS